MEAPKHESEILQNMRLTRQVDVVQVHVGAGRQLGATNNFMIVAPIKSRPTHNKQPDSLSERTAPHTAGAARQAADL